MRHFLIVIFFSLMCALNMSAQVSYSRPYSTDESLANGTISHTLQDDRYFLVLRNDHHEVSCVGLGKGASVAKESLKNILKMMRSAENGQHIKINYKEFTVFNSPIYRSVKELYYHDESNLWITSITSEEIEIAIDYIR